MTRQKTQLPMSEIGKVCAVLLDRDGVINRKPPEGRYVTSWEEFTFLPSVLEALAELANAGLQRGCRYEPAGGRARRHVRERRRRAPSPHAS